MPYDRVLILSDLHLGIKTSRAPHYFEKLAKFTDDFDAVVLNGDTLEWWNGNYEQPEMKKWLRKVERELKPTNGELILLTGNHDIAISNRHYFYHEPTQLLAFHGDFILDNPTPWKKVSFDFEKSLGDSLKNKPKPISFSVRSHVFRAVQKELYYGLDLKGEPNTAAGYLLKQIANPMKPLKILNYLKNAPERTVRTARLLTRSVQHVTIGHTHQRGQWKLDGVMVYNTGSFMPFSKPAAVIIDKGNVTYTPFEKLF